MSRLREKPFDNVVVSLRGKHCVLASVSPPFVTAYWPDVDSLASELRLAHITPKTILQQEAQGRFLSALADRAVMGDRFRPAKLGFESGAGEIRRAQENRHRYRLVTFLGDCSREVTLRALESISAQVQKRASVDVQFKDFDLLSDWSLGQKRIADVCDYLYGHRGVRSDLTVFSQLREIPAGLEQFIYEHPRVRIAWTATDLLCCADEWSFQDYAQQSISFKNLEKISDAGLWPHVVLPVSKANTSFLPEILLALLEVTRGCTIEVLPAPLLRLETEAAPPPMEQYLEALLEVCRNERIPLALVSPMSWVAARIDSQAPLPVSPSTSGVELAVLPSGDLYAGECSVGIERCHIGNIFDAGHLRWERLDAMPEAFSKSNLPHPCRICGWRYRCGGIDASVLLLQERYQAQLAVQVRGTNTGLAGESLSGRASLFQLFCQPRKMLFEELLWESVMAATKKPLGYPRERIETRQDGLELITVKGNSNGEFR